MIEFLLSLKYSLLCLTSLFSIGYLIYLKILIKFILKQSLLCSISINMNTYQCEKKAKLLIEKFSFKKHNPALKIKKIGDLHKAEATLLFPKSHFKSSLRLR